MDHEIGLCALEDVSEARHVTDITQTRCDLNGWSHCAQIHINGVKVQFRCIENGQAGRRECCNLPAEFCTDRAASARDKHIGIPDDVPYGLDVQLAFRTGQQVSWAHGLKDLRRLITPQRHDFRAVGRGNVEDLKHAFA